MAARAFTLNVGGTPVRLSDVYIGLTRGGPGGPAENIGGAAGNPNPISDVPYRQIVLQAVTADVQVGNDATVTTSKYGANISSTATVPPFVIGPWETGPVKLSDLWAVSGGSGVLHILAIPF